MQNDASLSSTAFNAKIRPGEVVIVAEQREIEGHQRARLFLMSQQTNDPVWWVSLTTAQSSVLFAPLQGATLSAAMHH